MLQQLKATVNEALKEHFKGRNAPERLEAAVVDVCRAVAPLCKEEAKPRLGATVMTETASANKTAAPRVL